MTKATIALDGATRAITCDALLETLSAEAQRLDQELARRDRADHPDRARDTCRRIRRLAALLDEVSWSANAAGGSIRIDPERQLPVAIAALRKALPYTEDNARDARIHGGAEEAIRASARLHDTWEALLSLEVQGMRSARPLHESG